MRYLWTQTSILNHPSLQVSDLVYADLDPVEKGQRFLKFREEMLLYYMFCGVRCIAAHVAFSNLAFARFQNQYRFVTMMREPRERFLSHYYYAHATMPLDSFLESTVAQRFGKRYLEYYSGVPCGADDNVESQIESALQNLDRFTVVGFLDRTDEFAEKIRTEFGFRPSIGHENQRSSPEKARLDDRPTAEQLREIERLCAVDIEIYEAARKRYC